MKFLTTGTGNEWSAKLTLNQDEFIYLGANAQKGPQLFVQTNVQTATSLSAHLYPLKFPEKQLVVPTSVEFKSLDGLTIYGQVFDNGDGKTNKPAVVFVHGGPSRQMLLGWHYSDYYANAYALNQYLAQQGFVVLSVNYRLGIGYGFEFQHPANFLVAPEYWDVKAAGEWLSKQSNVNPKKIGLWGGSYGGYLTAMGLGKDSKLFAAGVDIHGVHDWLVYNEKALFGEANKKAPDADWAANLIAKGSPTSYVSSWTSPVLFIHADDDRNVAFQQSIDLIKRLEKKKVKMETMVIVDDNHHWFKHENAVNVLESTAEFLKNQLMK
jgi:dipeptidyl aminopeptidase/acylaminoacyl peptidase